MKKLHNFNEVFDGQAVFRKVLEAMSNPGRVVSIEEQAGKMHGNQQAFLALAMTLLDNEVSFDTCGDRELANDISLITLSKEVSLEEADFIFLNRKEDLEQVFRHAKCGTLADPQKSATIIMKAEESCSKEWMIYGAGVDGTQKIWVPEIAELAMKLRDDQAYEYPQGVDMIFVNDCGELFCIPRLVMKEKQ